MPFVIAAVLATGCGDGDSAEETVKLWASAVNEQNWDRACELSTKSDDCEASLRENFDKDELTFQGPASGGGGTAPGESYFSLETETRSTVFVTAVPDGDSFRVRFEALVERAG